MRKLLPLVFLLATLASYAQDPAWNPGWTFKFFRFTPIVDGPELTIELKWRMDRAECSGPVVFWEIGQVTLNAYHKDGQRFTTIPGINASRLVEVRTIQDILPKELKSRVQLNIDIQYTINYRGTNTQFTQTMDKTRSIAKNHCIQRPFPSYAAEDRYWYEDARLMNVEIINASFYGQGVVERLVDKAPSSTSSKSDLMDMFSLDESEDESVDDSFLAGQIQEDASKIDEQGEGELSTETYADQVQNSGTVVENVAPTLTQIGDSPYQGMPTTSNSSEDYNFQTGTFTTDWKSGSSGSKRRKSITISTYNVKWIWESVEGGDEIQEIHWMTLEHNLSDGSSTSSCTRGQIRRNGNAYSGKECFSGSIKITYESGGVRVESGENDGLYKRQ